MSFRKDTRFRRWIPYVFILLIYLVTEGTCYLGLLLLRKKFHVSYGPNMSVLSENQRASLKKFLKAKKGEFVGQDPILGWVFISESNSAGMRDDREYKRVPPPDIVRTSAFGDSFTYGQDVALGETWEKQLAVLKPSMEVLNYGVGAYGLDQAYLRYLQVGTGYNPHIVFIGYMSENIARNVNVFRPFYSASYGDVIFTKPRFKVRDGKLVLLKNPVSTLEDHAHFLLHDAEVLAKLGESDYHYQTNYNKGAFDFLPTVRFTKLFWSTLNKKRLNPIFQQDGMYNVQSEAYEVTLKVFDAFYRKVLENGALPIIVIFPDINDQRRSRNEQERRYTPLLKYFHDKGYRFIDVLGALEPYESDYTVEELTRAWGHYSPLGNKIIAEYIFTHLETWHLKDQSKVKEAVRLARKQVGIAAQ
jgi:hypothetical protein